MTRKKEIPLLNGKVPPQAKYMEEAVLGALLLERQAYDVVNGLIRPEMFYVDANKAIYEAIQSLVKKGRPIDILTVREELTTMEKLEEVGGEYYITKLTNSVVSAANIEAHCDIIKGKFLGRELIRIGSEMINAGYDDTENPFDILEDTERTIQQVSAGLVENTMTPIDTVLVERVGHILTLQQQDSSVTGIPSGYSEIDRNTHGWQVTDLIILAARPAVGKTAFALNIARNGAKIGLNSGKEVKILFFSLEMSKEQLAERMLSAESGVPLEKIKTGKLTEQEFKHQLYAKGIQPLASLGIYIDDTAGLNVFQLRSKARTAMRKYGGKNVQWMIIVDYLQLMSGVEDRNTRNREQEISTISRNLKKIAKEEKVPVIALSQLSRNVEQRGGDKKPMLSDLRESGAIEQDADMVMFLYRPEYYDITTSAEGENIKGLTEVAISKNRNGSLAQGVEAIKLKAQLWIQKFIDWDEAEPSGFQFPTNRFKPIQSDRGNDDNPF